ncbi:COX assembly mitochondrial protein homolog [Arctopsyche grandis]|uniref:COX assembly mitochondrial protein homolog n=1 Tax=Arctopsyche grandis TaxID=121162 RepID=UPI00406D6E43
MWWFGQKEGETKAPEKTVLAKHLGGGPHGVGDPNDQSLRKVELNVLIPKRVRDISRKEKCIDVVRKFEFCAKENGLLMTVRCRQESNVMIECLQKWFNDEEFNLECKREYLKERTEYRRTGITKQMRERMAAGIIY